MSAARAAFLGLAWLVPAICAAQDLTPRAYFPTPVSSNAVVLTYAFSDGEVLFDPTLLVTDSTGTIRTSAVSYYYAFDFFGRSANITGALPFAAGDVLGEVSGEPSAVHRAGMADTIVRLAVNLKGGPARTPLEFVKAGPIRSVLGASLKVVMPTGQYDHTRLINLGTNRWAFKPEVGYARRVRRVIVEAYGGVWHRSSPANAATWIMATRSRATAAKGRPPAVSWCTSRPNVRVRSSSTSDWRTSLCHVGSTMRASTPTTRRNSPARWIATCRIDQLWKERQNKYRGQMRTARSRGVNRAVTQWPSVRHETTVLGGVKGALRRLRRP